MSQYFHASKTTEVLRDLMRINSDRTNGYQGASYHYENLDSSIRNAFNMIASEGNCYVHDLQQKLKQLDGGAKSITVPGKIYRAWSDLKVEFAYNTQKSMISSFLYNEEIALHTYEAAISNLPGLNIDIIQFLEVQADGLKKNYEQLKRYRKISYSSETSLMYLV